MEGNNRLLPLAFDISKVNGEKLALSTLPRAREEIDVNASGTFFHTRGPHTHGGRTDPHEQSSELNSATFNSSSDILQPSDFVMDEDQFPFTSTQSKRQKNVLYPDISNFSSEEITLAEHTPSSPPMRSYVDESDLDLDSAANRTFVVPSSPPRFDSAAVVQSFPMKLRSNTVPCLKRKRSEEFNFGIDKFNRVHGIHSDQLSSELGDDEPQILRNSPTDYARNYISQCFEDQRTEILLDHLQITDIPDEIEDLKNLILFDENGTIVKPKLEIYLSHNKIRTITPRLFDLGESLHVLSFRTNKIKHIPGAIGRLSNLHYLNLSSNSIQFLPYQILEMEKLQNLLLRPNYRLKECSDSDLQATSDEELRPGVRRRFVGKIKYVNIHEHSKNPLAVMLSRNLSILSQISEKELDNDHIALFDNGDVEEQLLLEESISDVPRLTELCLRKLSSYKTSKSETNQWRKAMGLNTSKLVAKAFLQNVNDEKCFTCKNTVIQHVGEVLEWWDIHDTKSVPIRKTFCCKRCIKIWEEENL